MRPELERFAEEMESKLVLNDHKGGWDQAPFLSLIQKLKREVTELEEAFEGRDFAAMSRESTDVANFAMMIFDKFQKTYSGNERLLKKIKDGD